MTKDELIKHMETVLAEVISQDEENWAGLDEHEEDLDKAWHLGYASAIRTVKEML